MRSHAGRSHAGGSGETVTVMVDSGGILPEQVQQAKKDLGIKISLVECDITKLIAMLTSGNPPDLVRGVEAVDLPFFAARDVAEELDPHFARSAVPKLDDLDRRQRPVAVRRPRPGQAACSSVG